MLGCPEAVLIIASIALCAIEELIILKIQKR